MPDGIESFMLPSHTASGVAPIAGQQCVTGRSTRDSAIAMVVSAHFDCSVLAWAKSPLLDSGGELLTSIRFVNRGFYVKPNFMIDNQSSGPEGCVGRQVWLEPPHFVSHK